VSVGAVPYRLTLAGEEVASRRQQEGLTARHIPAPRRGERRRDGDIPDRGEGESVGDTGYRQRRPWSTQARVGLQPFGIRGGTVGDGNRCRIREA
jgi:hypothetical protein